MLAVASTPMAMRATLRHVMLTYLLCGLLCFAVYLMKWPETGWAETEVNHVYYSFWQLLGLISQMLLISAALILCITLEDIRSATTFTLSTNQRRLMAVVAVINIIGGLVNTSSALGRSMAATFLLARYDQLSLYILPLAVSVIQIIVAVILLMELQTCTSEDSKESELLLRTLPVELPWLEAALAGPPDVPYIIIMPDHYMPKKEAQH